jgi:hypothetical protein
VSLETDQVTHGTDGEIGDEVHSLAVHGVDEVDPIVESAVVRVEKTEIDSRVACGGKTVECDLATKAKTPRALWVLRGTATPHHQLATACSTKAFRRCRSTEHPFRTSNPKLYRWPNQRHLHRTSTESRRYRTRIAIQSAGCWSGRRRKTCRGVGCTMGVLASFQVTGGMSCWLVWWCSRVPP